MDLAALKATATRLLKKSGKAGVLTVKSDVLNGRDQTTNVTVRIMDRSAKSGEPVACIALMTATPFPVNGGELVTDGKTYDIVQSDQNGVDSQHVMQKVVLHER